MRPGSRTRGLALHDARLAVEPAAASSARFAPATPARRHGGPFLGARRYRAEQQGPSLGTVAVVSGASAVEARRRQGKSYPFAICNKMHAVAGICKQAETVVQAGFCNNTLLL